MLLKINKLITLILVILMINACSQESQTIKEFCSKAVAPPDKSFDELTLKAMNIAYEQLIQSCEDKQSSKIKIAYKFANLAKLYMVNDMNVAAFDSFQFALKIHSNQFDWHYLSGILQERIGNLEVATEQFTLAYGINPKNIPNLIRLAENLKLRNNNDKAKETLDKIFSLSPDQPIALQIKAQLLIDNEQYHEAEVLLSQLIKDYPKANKLNYVLSNALRNQGRIEESAVVLKSAGSQSLLLKDPILESLNKLVTGAGGYILLANKARKTGNLAVAKTYLLTAIKIEANNVSALHNLGYLSGIEGDHQVAMQYLKKALEISPNNIDIASDYASALVALRKYQEAIAVYNGILEISPNDIEAISRKSKIESFISSQK